MSALCSDSHISELAEEARNGTAFHLRRAAGSCWNSNMVSLMPSVTELMHLLCQLLIYSILTDLTVTVMMIFDYIIAVV